MNRPELSSSISDNQFRNYYYLKEELVVFCRQEDMQTSGNKEQLTERIAHYISTGEKKKVKGKKTAIKKLLTPIQLDTLIEDDFVCSETHRTFYKQQIGLQFSFNVQFQKWLKENSGKTYQDSIIAYHEILEKKKTSQSVIDKQFEYNTYIRDFFEENKDKTLKDAITCWKYKKKFPGHNRYEENDLISLKSNSHT